MMRRKRNYLVAVVALSCIAAVSLAFVTSGKAGAQHAAGPDESIVKRIGPPLTGAMVDGTHVTVVSVGSDAASGLRGQWYAGVAAAAIHAETPSITDVSLVGNNGTEQVVDNTQFNGREGLSVAAGDELTAAGVLAQLRARASDAGARVTNARVLPMFGGALAVTIAPADPTTFLANAGEKIAAVLGPLGSNDHAYLVTVIGASGNDLLVIGWNPALGGTAGHGTAWAAPSVDTNAIWARTSRSHSFSIAAP